MTVEVFKTNVKDADQARMLVEQIHATFGNYQANFDLEDCDRILRVVCRDGLIQTALLMSMVRNSGFHAEILPDVVPEIFHV
ncbi:MAG TPA: hypothetical protein VFO54_06580 [Chryseosolibacter sp.]|nr:hypothetical protein [Chryseosolibacter sp.]